VAAWKQSPDDSGLSAWDNLRIATRLGENPKILLTTTPKRVQLLYDLLEERDKTGRVHVARGSTMDNAGALGNEYLESVLGIYGGTNVARQELYGEMLDDLEGTLWSLDMIHDARVSHYPPNVPLMVIGVDPSVAEKPTDYCGIVVCGATSDYDLYKRQAWVIEDASILGSPQEWAERVVKMAQKYGCPVVAEVNQGGALVKNAIHQIDPTVVVLEVHSKYGKQLRAEPVTLAYQQERVHHVNVLPELETEMTMWIPGSTTKSPDRVDALVHALTALLIKPPPGFHGGKITARSPASRRMQLPTASGLAGQRRPGGFRVR
jgi:phage terminase large subunit-like protein